MGFLLLVLLIVELIFIYYFNGKEVVSPSFIACAVCCLSTFVYVLNMRSYYGYIISLETVLIIPYLIFLLFIGESLSKSVTIRISRQNLRNKSSTDEGTIESIDYSKIVVVILFLFVLISGFYCFKDVFKYSLAVGNTYGDYQTMVKYVRYDGGYSTSTILSQCNVLSDVIVYFSFYVFFHNTIVCKLKKQVFYLLPAVGYIFYILSYSGRSNIIKILCVISIILFIKYKESIDWKSYGNWKLIRVGVLAVVLFLVVFRILGYRTDTSAANSLWANLSEYISAGIVGLDYYLFHGQSPNTVFGESIFKSLIITLIGWGVDLPMPSAHDEFFSYMSGRSNIYTGFKAFIKDFGVIGASLSMILIGAIVNSLWKRIKMNDVSFVKSTMLGLLFYPIVMMSIDNVWPSILSMTAIYVLVYLKIIDVVFIKRKFAVGSKKEKFNLGG